MADDEATDSNDDTTDDQPDDHQEEEFKPPSKEEWEKVRQRLKRANEEAAKNRTELAKQLRKEQSDEDAAKEREAAASKWQRTAVTNAAVAELQGAGYTKAQAKRLARVIDLSNVQIDDDGEIDLEDEIEQLAKDFPPDKGVARGAGARVTTGRGRSDSEPADDVDSKFAKNLLRQGGFR
jgi:hypothetical protein